jgi:hypothetical protein
MKKINTLLLSCFALIQFSVFAQAPVANFSYSSTCVDVGTMFTDLSTNTPNSFYWTFGDGNTSTSQNPTHIYTTPGNYTVTLVAINANGSDTIPQVVTIYANPTVIVGADQTICMGSATTLSATGGSTYNWSPATGLSSPTVANPSASPTTTTTYTITATDVNGCVATDMVNVMVNPLPNVNAGMDEWICFGASTTLSASGASTFNWTPATGLSSSTVANPTANPTSTTTYTLTGTDAFGCVASDMVTITVNPQITLSDNVTNVSCNGGTDGSVNITPIGGQAPYAYFWSPIGATTAVVSGITAGNYTVTVTDANGCTNMLNSTVTEPTAITVNPSSSDVTCDGTCDGTISLTPSGGTGSYSYSWSPGGMTTQNVTNLCAGTYTYTITDANGCTYVDNHVIDQILPTSVINGYVYYQTVPITAGVAELIRKNGSLPEDMILERTVSINPTSGEFIFDELTPGDYIVKVLGDTTIYNCATTYAVNTAQWQLAQVYSITANCGDSIYLDIDLIELPANSGPGTINGRLVEGGGVFNKAPGEPIPDIDITVDQSPGGAVMAAATTDINGYFTINNLPIGTYTVYADMHGYGVTLQTIDINATTPSYDVVLCSDTAIDMIDMCEMTVTSVKKVATTNQLSIYPNPAKTTVNIVYNGSEALNLEATDITGKKVMSQNLKSNTKTIDVANLSRGLYLVRLYNQHDDFIQKLVIE